MNKIDIKLIDAWKVLVLAEYKTIDDVPDKYKEAVSIEVAKQTIKVLGDD